MVRVGAAVAMMTMLFCAVYIGHLAVGCLWSILTVGIFKELVAVAHREGNAERDIPWFRSVLWAWFVVSMLAAYTMPSLQAPMHLPEKMDELPVIGPMLSASLGPLKRYSALLSLWGYAGAFVWTVLSLRINHLATQLRILSFTVFALSLFVVPMKMAIHNTFAGLFWFIFPLMLVATNDSMAYFAGFLFGKKIIKRPFLAISPNKTWEGFIGGGIATIVAGWLLPLVLLHPWFTCSFKSIEAAGVEGCQPHTVFSAAAPWGGVGLEIQYHGLCLAVFASTIAPFGGFAASAIKRAYKIKDFANWIPGHGGFVDRLDCQFLMALATFVHLKTYVLIPSSPFERAMGAVASLSPDDRALLLQALAEGTK